MNIAHNATKGEALVVQAAFANFFLSAKSFGTNDPVRSLLLASNIGFCCKQGTDYTKQLLKNMMHRVFLSNGFANAKYQQTETIMVRALSKYCILFPLYVSTKIEV